MIQSMTGFGAAESGPFRVELSSVNHRFLDIVLRMPPYLAEHEVPLRNKIRERFSRGRISVSVSVVNDKDHKVTINIVRAKEVYHALQELKNELLLHNPIDIGTIAGFRDLFMSAEVSYNAESLYAAFGNALVRLLEMRKQEGETIVEDMFLRLGIVEQHMKAIARLCPEMEQGWKVRFRERLSSLSGDIPLDEQKVLQEIILMVGKMDVTEEMVRLTSHIEQMRKFLAAGDTIGRKAEFLLQELHREITTIASKTEDSRVSLLVVDMKAEVERLREQVQNIQ